MISALLTASLQTMNTLKDVQESIENNTLNKADVNSAFVQNLSPINEKLDKIIEEQQSLSNKITMVEAKTQQTTNKVKEIDENLTVVIQGVTAIISKQNDGKTIISEYESTYLADIVNAIVTTQSNVKTMVTALQAINGEIKQMRTEVVDLSDSFVDTTSKVRAMELKETTGYTVSEPTSLDDSIAALERFTK
jgi:chromosome segregation ATPase